MFDMIVRNHSLTVNKTCIATFVAAEKRTVTQHNQHLQAIRVTAYHS